MQRTSRSTKRVVQRHLSNQLLPLWERSRFSCGHYVENQKTRRMFQLFDLTLFGPQVYLPREIKSALVSSCGSLFNGTNFSNFREKSFLSSRVGFRWPAKLKKNFLKIKNPGKMNRQGPESPNHMVFHFFDFSGHLSPTPPNTKNFFSKVRKIGSIEQRTMEG